MRSNDVKIPRSQAAVHGNPMFDQSVQFDQPVQFDQSVQFHPSVPSSGCEDQPPLNPSSSMETPHYHF